MRRIDFHHHPTLPSGSGRDPQPRRPDPRGNPSLGWSLERSLEEMDQGDTQLALLSVGAPPKSWSTDLAEARTRARQWNEFMKKMCVDHPSRFGTFAILPIYEMDAALAEAAYALDTLKADGIALNTNIGEKWLGDAYYAPLFEELNRRKAVVYSHPTAPWCCSGILPELADSALELGFDTSRAIAKMIFTGSASRYPAIRFVFSHGGGTMPFLLERFQRAHFYSSLDLAPRIPNGAHHEIKRFYYEIAQAAHRGALLALKEAVPVSQILFGTDFPYRTSDETGRMLVASGVFTEDELRGIDCENAWRLLPHRRAVPV